MKSSPPQTPHQLMWDPTHHHASHTTYTYPHHVCAQAEPSSTSSPPLGPSPPLVPPSSHPYASYNNRNRGTPYSYIVFPSQSHLGRGTPVVVTVGGTVLSHGARESLVKLPPFSLSFGEHEDPLRCRKIYSHLLSAYRNDIQTTQL
jgi:hypothetical protein